MNIGLVDVDNHNFPNLALMKLSAYHKALGDNVEWANALFGEYDIVYQAKVFTFTDDDNIAYNAKSVIRGGTGYDLKNKLPAEAEHVYPDYSLYGIKDTAYGYLSRGCPRGCNFCIVAEKEGRASVKVADLNEWWSGQKKIVLLDPNIIACKEWENLIGQLVDSKAWIDFTQGLDIRLMTEEKAKLISKCKVKMIHFAWDNPEDTITPKLLEKFSGAFDLDYRRKKVYVLSNFNSTHEPDLYRVETLKSMGYDPYLMIYEKWNAPRITRLLQRYVNNKLIFRTCPSFKDYLASGHKK